MWVLSTVKTKKDTQPHYKSTLYIWLLWAKITYLKSHAIALGFWPQMDISNEALNTDFGWGEKVGGWKKNLPV